MRSPRVARGSAFECAIEAFAINLLGTEFDDARMVSSATATATASATATATPGIASSL